MSQHARSGGGTRRGRSEMSNMSNIALRDGDAVTPADRGREFWRGVLLAGGSTVLPRWTLNPVPGVHEHEATIPDELVAALRRLANELAVPLSTVLLTAHAKVLGALSGERDVSTGYATKSGSLLTCRLAIGARTWRELLLETARAESQLGSTEPLFETVFEPVAGAVGELAQDSVLRVGFVERDGIVLRLRYKM